MRGRTGREKEKVNEKRTNTHTRANNPIRGETNNQKGDRPPRSRDLDKDRDPAPYFTESGVIIRLRYGNSN